MRQLLRKEMILMSESLKLPYGLRDGKIKHISEIPESQRGLRCGCICPKCLEPLQARIGTKRVKHFAHNQSSNCFGGGESGLHLLAKEVFLRNNKILLPDVDLSVFEYSSAAGYYNHNLGYSVDKKVVKKGDYFQYINVKLECFINRVKPDIMLTNGKSTLYIEIVVTHDIDEEKYEKIKTLDVSVLKINLKDFYNDVLSKGTKENLEKILIHEKAGKFWVNNYWLNKALKEEKDKHARIVFAH